MSKEIIRDKFNKLAPAIVILFGGLALTACATETTPTPVACTVKILPGDKLFDIAFAAKDDEDGASLRGHIAEIERINSGVDAGHLTPGDELGLSKNMCDAIEANPDTSIYVVPFPPAK